MSRLAVILLLGSTLVSYAQTDHKLDFKIDGWRDTTVYLGYHQGESTFVKDTAEVNTIGEFSFTGANLLPEGFYFLALGSRRPQTYLSSLSVTHKPFHLAPTRHL